MDEQDQSEPEVKKPSATELQEKIQQLKDRKQNYQDLKEQLAESSDKQVSPTDSDARSMRVRDGVTEVCYNVQAVVDAKHKLIVAHEVTNDVSDKGQLARMAISAKEV